MGPVWLVMHELSHFHLMQYEARHNALVNKPLFKKIQPTEYQQFAQAIFLNFVSSHLVGNRIHNLFIYLNSLAAQLQWTLVSKLFKYKLCKITDVIVATRTGEKRIDCSNNEKKIGLQPYRSLYEPKHPHTKLSNVHIPLHANFHTRIYPIPSLYSIQIRKLQLTKLAY